MAVLAKPVASRLGGTTFGGFGAAAIDIGSRCRATTDLVGAIAASSLLSPTFTFAFAAAPTFPVATAAAAYSAATTVDATAGEHTMASMGNVGPLLHVSRKSVVPFSYSLDYIITADNVTRCKVPCLHLVFSRQSVDEDCV